MEVLRWHPKSKSISQRSSYPCLLLYMARQLTRFLFMLIFLYYTLVRGHSIYSLFLQTYPNNFQQLYPMPIQKYDNDWQCMRLLDYFLHLHIRLWGERFLLLIGPFRCDLCSGWHRLKGSWTVMIMFERQLRRRLMVVPFQGLLCNILVLLLVNFLPIWSFMFIFAYSSALRIIGKIWSAWCSAVYLGRKPVPGGVINVFLGLEIMFPYTSTIPKSIKYLLPTPTLFALP